MKCQIPKLAAAFIPPALFFLIVGAGGLFLRRFPYYGPVNPLTGQPMIANYPEVLFFSAAGLLIAGLFISFLLLRRAPDGWLKVFIGLGLVLLIPVQAIFLVILELGLFGK